MSTPLPPLVEPAAELTREEVQRYSRHLIIPDLGLDGQKRLKNAKVLVIGAGGLGSPTLLYLAAAGVGTIGIVEFDVVDESNLQRQIIHGQSDIGRSKGESARDSILEVNPLVEVRLHEYRLEPDNAVDLFEQTDACGSSSALLFPVAGGTLGYVSHSNGEAARVLILDAGGETLLFFANAVPGGDQWSFIGLGQDLFETFQFAVTGGPEPTPSPTPGPSSPASPQPSAPSTESPSGPVLPDTALGVAGGGATLAGILALAFIVGSAAWMVGRRR